MPPPPPSFSFVKYHRPLRVKLNINFLLIKCIVPNMYYLINFILSCMELINSVLIKTLDFIPGCGFIENTRFFMKISELGLNPMLRNIPSSVSGCSNPGILQLMDGRLRCIALPPDNCQVLLISNIFNRALHFCKNIDFKVSKGLIRCPII